MKIKRYMTGPIQVITYLVYDEEIEGYVCDVDMDEDDYARLLSSSYKQCPYYQSNDEYKIVRHQM